MIRYTLTEAKLRAIKANGKQQKITDGGGLSVRISPTGTKSFSYAYRVTGVNKDGATGEDGKVERAVGFGTYPDVTLEDARKMHKAARQLVAQDKCPAAAKKAEAEARLRKARNGDGTFKAFSELWMKDRTDAKKWRKVYADRVKAMLERDAFPWIGKMPLEDVKPADIRELMLKKKAAPTQAMKLRGLLFEVFEFCIANLHLPENTNPAASLKKHVITVPKAQHHKKMERIELGAFWRALTALENGLTQPSSIAAAKFLTLTGLRKGEVLKAEWSEMSDLDGEEPLFTIPAAKMKMGLAHKVPLSRQAVEILKAQRDITGGRRYVFTGIGKATPMASCTLNAMWNRLEGVRSDLTVHATRATITSILHSERIGRDVIDRILAHVEQGSDKPYYQDELLPERRKALQHYADLVEVLAAGANVVPIKKRAAA